MNATNQLPSATQNLIYGRTRIVSTLSSRDPQQYASLQATDIQSIRLQGEQVVCLLADGEIKVDRSAVLANFWEHRTRTPPFFDYKTWTRVERPKNVLGVPVGAIDYRFYPNRIALDSKGDRKLYFVDEVNKTCTCGSWHQLNEHKEALAKEFEHHGLQCFQTTCKHLMWAEANTRLQALRYQVKDAVEGYNPRLCVYSYNHQRGMLLYRVTYDGVKANGQWFPVEGWKEKPVYGFGGIPTGECWDTFFAALSQQEPFKVIPFSSAVSTIMNSTRSKN
jgi:hypothetical protein